MIDLFDDIIEASIGISIGGFIIKEIVMDDLIDKFKENKDCECSRDITKKGGTS